MSLEQYRITHLLRQQLKARAEHIALEGFEMAAPWDKVSWNEFNRISAAIAGTLIANGFEVQDRAVILSHNCPQWTCVDVGVIRARGVVVPVYPTSTLEQAAYIINDAGAKLLFVDNKAQYELACELESLCPTLNCVVVFDKQVTLKQPHHQHLDTLLEQTVPEEARTELAAMEQSATLDDLLTLIYTSGTTGDPKGVMLDQRNFASAMRQHQQKIPFSSDQVSLVFLPLSHVYERGWSFYVLSRGGRNVYLADTQRVKEAIAAVRPHTLCVVPRFLEKVYSAVQDKVARAGNGRRKLFAWALSVGERQFEVMQGRAKPSAWLSLQWRLADKLVYGKLRAALGGRLQLMPCGGAALDAKVSAFFAAINLPVLCGYGMTETTATVTCNTLDNRVTGSNGRCMPEVEVRLGAENEILVRGDTVMRGYFNRPKDTAEAFEDGWLRTGDAGYLDEQGNLFITDRIKELMKTSNGKYIAPQRVEGKVGCCPFIEQVAVVADARNYVTALIVPAFEALEAWAKQKGLSYESPLELIRHSHVVEHFEERLKHLQQELAGFEQIKKFTLLPEAFSMEAGLITPTLKLRRKMIYHKYSREINAMYGG
ncbi:AMP-dependent synthetase/ligase [Shewanella algae]|uniref:Long-chain-fatty-acid--CoA ligase FadD15 n=1 Tax=Shewanella algae TaxID=38313 RepID=A0A379ZFE9_9GAMM|nr:long-chain fatty acid--CoA ligase [Shewanella algae]MBO2609760.1 long-chain fatty acid--CoA ligase [Shewanella algae]MBO2672889.1 long-chain fatty acid--CoA ligase [Shewanella algae]OHY56888.1 long-chain fatty acid--CoA ligase [Shewanella algae]TWU68820.1 long-chain fatty acid--CoA ligase [Shewanella algae]SUI61160.1 Long-chain-fatty-acid--CoA ligase FadD15 [Shewanella algae]